MLANMRFKTFTFPHNPSTYQIDFSRTMVEHLVPNGTYVLQNLGRNGRVFQGEGEFYGDDAYTNFKALATLFYEETPGQLYHPIWQSSNAYFTKLYLKQEPRADYVAYGFTFQEGYFGYDETTTVESSDATPTTHTVVIGQNLWQIATIYGLTITYLLSANPSIANPNILSVGSEVAL